MSLINKYQRNLAPIYCYIWNISLINWLHLTDIEILSLGIINLGIKYIRY